ncbi:MAG: O-antigen ligase family protein [Acaryochloridaceae cyanobacterium RU_4_10]|nr:O-antigen ligase family protein [Acaryochloridaceae cyanobacterium RU_4_10]
MLVGFALLSIAWSSAPGETFKSDINLIRVILFGIFFAARYRLREQIHLLALTFGVAILCSFVFGGLFPKYGVMGMGLEVDQENLNHAGSWRGIFTHKNAMGRFITLGTLIFFLTSPYRKNKQSLKWLAVASGILLILLSTSKSSLIILATLIALIPLFRALRWNYSKSIPFIMTILFSLGSIITLFLDNAELILSSMGKDMTLTGRTDLWSEVLISIGEKPWFGYGLGGFWRGLKGESEVIIKVMQWEVPHSHNGFLDILLDLGIVGLILFVISFTATYLRAMFHLRHGDRFEYIFPSLFLTFLLMANLTESSFFRQGFMMLLFTVVTFSTHRIQDLKESIPPSRNVFWGFKVE